MFMLFIDRCVNQRIPPAIRSSNESNVDAAIAKEPLFTVAYICNRSKVTIKYKINL